jgi:hypothetical protein
VAQDPRAELTAELARDLVAELAPHELPLFGPISRAYFADPERAARSEGGDDEMLGFGVAGAESFITPALLAVLSPVVAYLLDQVKSAASREGSALAIEWVRWVIARARPPSGASAGAVATGTSAGAAPAGAPRGLTPVQLAWVRDTVLKRASELRLPPGRAELLADAVTGRLAVAPA